MIGFGYKKFNQYNLFTQRQKMSDPLLLDYSRTLYDWLSNSARTEYNSRQEHIAFLLRGISTSSLLLASGWIILVSSSRNYPLTTEIKIACILHVITVALAVLTAFALILSHTFSKTLFTETTDAWSKVYSHALIAKDLPGQNTPDYILPLHSEFSKINVELNEIWNPRIRVSNLVSWFLGGTTVLLFIASIIFDIKIAFCLNTVV